MHQFRRGTLASAIALVLATPAGAEVLEEVVVTAQNGTPKTYTVTITVSP